MHDAQLWELILRLVVACILGAAIGYQREITGHPAGLRTHILVCVGSALFTMASITFGSHSDPSRIASNIVTGIGFLGAGTIIRQGMTVRGLTTAASLWTVAAIGLGIGAGGKLYILSVSTAVLVLAVLSWVDILEERLLARERYRNLSVQMKKSEGNAESVLEELSRMNISILSAKRELGDGSKEMLRLRIKLPSGTNNETVNRRLIGISVVEAFDWE
jgi:putative Mg2+ transporter-C (MgtC) family protein